MLKIWGFIIKKQWEVLQDNVAQNVLCRASGSSGSLLKMQILRFFSPHFCAPIDCTGHGILQARILEWVAFPFSRGSSQPRNQTRVSCIAGGFFTNWAIREAQSMLNHGSLPPPTPIKSEFPGDKIQESEF